MTWKARRGSWRGPRAAQFYLMKSADVETEFQARIVRMIDNPGDHVPRFMATSQTDVAQAMEDGRLRQDLYYRLDGAALHVPEPARAGR